MKVTNARIIELLGEGYTVKEIAGFLDVNRRSLEKKIAKLKKDYHCKNNVQLVKVFEKSS